MSFIGSDNTALGIDIGSNSVKIVQIKKAGMGRELEKFAMAPLPPNVFGPGGELTDVSSVSAVIKDLLKAHKFQKSNVFASISSQNVIMRFLKIPPMEESEIASTLEFQSSSYLPYELDQCSMAHQVLAHVDGGGDGGAGELLVLMVAVKKLIVESYTAALKGAGVAPRVMEVDTTALLNAVEAASGGFGGDGGGGEVVAVIDVGASTSSISVLIGGVLHFTRNILVAGNSITDKIAENMQVPFEQAEEMKVHEGSIDLYGSESPDSIPGLVRMVLDDLAMELRRSFDFFKAQTREPQIDRIIFTGGTGKMQNFSGFLSNELSVSAMEFNPIDILSVTAPDGESFPSDVLQYSVAIGLALGGLEDK